MHERYVIRRTLDNLYRIYEKESTIYVFQGTLEEVNAWVELTEKGFNIITL